MLTVPPMPADWPLLAVWLVLAILAVTHEIRQNPPPHDTHHHPRRLIP